MKINCSIEELLQLCSDILGDSLEVENVLRTQIPKCNNYTIFANYICSNPDTEELSYVLKQKENIATQLIRNRRRKPVVPFGVYPNKIWKIARLYPLVNDYITRYHLLDKHQWNNEEYTLIDIFKLDKITEYKQNYLSKFRFYCAFIDILAYYQITLDEFIENNQIYNLKTPEAIDNVVDEFLQDCFNISFKSRIECNQRIVKSLIEITSNNLLPVLEKANLNWITSETRLYDAIYLYQYLEVVAGDIAYQYNLFKINNVDYFALIKTIYDNYGIEYIDVVCNSRHVNTVLKYMFELKENKEICLLYLNFIKSLDSSAYGYTRILDYYYCYLTKSRNKFRSRVSHYMSLSMHRLYDNLFIKQADELYFDDIENVVQRLLDNQIKQRWIESIDLFIHDFAYYDVELCNYIKTINECYSDTCYKQRLQARECGKQQLIDRKFEQMKEDLPIANSIITAFLEGGYPTKTRYCRENNLEVKQFDYYVSVVKEYNQILKERYDQKVENIQKQQYAIFLQNAQEILLHLKNAKETGNKFHLLDYYLQTKMELSDMQKLISSSQQISQEDKQLFYNFCKMNQKKMYFVSFNKIKDDFWQIGEHVMTPDEKKNIFQFMMNHNIPIYLALYNEIGRRYVKGTLSLL